MAQSPEAPQPIVRRQIKQLGVNLLVILRALEHNGTFDGVAKVRGMLGPTRVIVRCRSRDSESWAMSVIFEGERIDGVDWEKTVEDHRGKAHKCSGWHRHIWKYVGRDKHKECLPRFDLR